MNKSFRGWSKDLREFYKIYYEFFIRNEEYLKDYKRYCALGACDAKAKRIILNKHKLKDIIRPDHKGDWAILASCRAAVALDGDAPLSEVMASDFLADYNSPHIKKILVDVSYPMGVIMCQLWNFIRNKKQELGFEKPIYKQFNSAARTQLRVYDLRSKGKNFKEIASIMMKAIYELHPKEAEDSVRKAYKTAEGYVKNGYKISL